MPDRWTRLKDIVAEASELAPEEQERYLANACADDDTLHAEAREVLAAGLEDDAFLTPFVGEEAGIPVGTRIGPFRIARRLARGGMGTVYEATQSHPTRKVALKVMHDTLLSAASRERFRFEIDALGALGHPGIARIFQAGVHREEGATGRRELLWFAMEFVENARTLRDVAKDQTVDRGMRIDLVAAIADAVHHGHQKGVIHRDLKPDNLLLGGDGRARVVDFGVAKVTDDERRWATIQTETREIVGTLAYMSPEQARGAPADVRSDVYALGVVLYELLTGRLPIPVDAHDFITSARRISEDAPQRPSTVDPDLRGDVEAVLLKALAKRPEERYASAAALAADLRSYRAGEPVQARIPSTWEQLRAFARRHRVLVLAGTAVLVVSIAAAAVSIAFALRSKDAERLAQQRTDEAQRERDRAAQLLEGALERNVKATFEVVPRMHALPGGARIAADVMQATVRDLETLLERSQGNAAVRLALAEAQRKLGDALGNPAYANLGDEEGAHAAYARALELAATLHDEAAQRVPAVVLSVRVLRKRAQIRSRRSPTPEALDDLQRARALGERLLAQVPQNEELRTHTALVHHTLGYAHLRRLELDRAAEHGREAVRRFEAIWEAHPERALNGELLAEVTSGLARILVQRQELEQAAALYDRAIELVASGLERSERPGAARGFLMTLRQYRGALAMRLQEYDVADELLTQAKDHAIARARADPADGRLRVSVCMKLIDWVRVAELQHLEADAKNVPEAARARARKAAETIEELAADADSKMVKVFAQQLRAYADGKLPPGSLMGSFGR